MSLWKRITVSILMGILLLSFLPVTAVPTHAATTDQYFDEIQCAEFPMDTLYIVRTNTKLDPDQYEYADPSGGHVHYAFDLSRGNGKVYAPFDMEVVSIGGSNTVIAQSLRPVRLADGRVNYLTCAFTHDNNISNIKKGSQFQQGTYFYDQGTKGTKAKHLHLEIALGKPCSKSKSFGSNLTALRKNGIQVYEALFLSPSTKISKDYISYNGSKIRLAWKTRQEIVFHGNVSGMSDLTRHYPVNTAFGSLPTPVNSGKLFDGWYTAKTGGTKVTASTKVTKSHANLYARWKDLPVKFNKKVTMKAQSVTETNAELSATVKLSTGQTAKKAGFYIGTNKDYLTKCAKDKTVNNTNLSKGVTFKVSDYGFALRPGTKYYYRFYGVINGYEVCSEVASFTTKGSSGQTTQTPAKTPTQTTLSPKWSAYSASKITQNSATISAKVTYGKSVKVEKVGFYLGTASNKLTKSTVYDKVNANRSSSTISYNLSSKGVKLNAGTTYYYQFYTVVAGKEYKSAVKSFKTTAAVTQTPTQTQKLTPQWTNYTTTGITSTNATVGVKVTYGKTVTPEKCGFYIGTNKIVMAKAKKYDTITGQRSYSSMSFDLNKYLQTLKPATTYYCRFYVVVDGVEYASNLHSFTTKPETLAAPEETALSPLWSDYSVGSITQTNATIGAKVTYGKTVIPEKCGFYIGTSQASLSKAAKFDSINATRTYSGMSYDLNKYGYPLNPGTTYYYRFYVIVDGQEYQSDIKSFTTAKAELSPVWSEYKVSNVTKTNATIAAKVTYGKTVKPEKCGFYIGTSKDNLEKAEKFDSINATRTYSGMSYGMNKYGYTLKAGTTYYYRFYVIVNGVEYLSQIKSFTTAK